MPYANRPGDLLADRYRLVDLLSESSGGRFWRAQDQVLERDVAVHVISADDERADVLMEAARRSATVLDQHLLRVLDADTRDDLCFVVNEWGSGTSLDIMLAAGGPLGPRQAGWLVREVATAVAIAHGHGVWHGRLNPEDVLVDRTGSVKVIGLCVDAALHGAGPGSAESDVTDLAGLLYAALTGRWAGRSPSAVTKAPYEHGHVLRPRQVRAGVPRVLDQICDELLNPYTPGRMRELRALDTAAGLAEVLTEFVGDPMGLPASLVARSVARGDETIINLPALPDPPVESDEPEPDVPELDGPELDGPERDDPAPVVPAEEATQAGLPIFDDDADDVSWLMAPGEPAPPPPPFEAPPERPLFAPSPAPGEPSRRPRPSAVAAAAADPSDFWPWESSTGTGTGVPIFEEPVEPPREPGRRTFRAAAVLLAILLVVVAAVVVVSIVKGGLLAGAEDESAPTTASPSTQTRVGTIDGLTATDFDPQGDPPKEEYPENAKLAVDGSPATGWYTSTYTQNLGPRGLKTGVGLIIDLRTTATVSAVALRMTGQPTGVSLYLTDQRPTSVATLDPVATASVGLADTIELSKPATGRYLVVWLTSLPRVSGGFRGQVDEVSVRGR